MIATPVLDPFEIESTLAQEPRVLSFSPRSFQIPMEELLRHLSFDLVGAIPRPLGEVKEELEGDAGPFSYRLRFFHLGQAVLALATEIEERGAEHRVIELLGVGEDLRLRINMTRLLQPGNGVEASVRQAAAQGLAVGQARIWGSDTSKAAGVRHTLSKQMRQMGISSEPLGREAREPTYRPPAAGRLVLEGLSENDLVVADQLLALLANMPAEGCLRRSPRRMGEQHERLRRGSASIVSFHYEIHRAATGVLHMRRREVEAGVERPGLVRTFNVAGLGGGARLRIREIGGRATAEFAGTLASVAALHQALAQSMGGRP